MMFRKSLLLLTFLVLGVGAPVLAQPVLAQNGDNVSIAHSESPENFAVSYGLLSQSTLAGNKPNSGRAAAESLKFNAFSRHFDVRLSDNATLLSAEQRARLSSSIEIYRGKINGVAASWARLVIVDGAARGLLFDGADLYAMEIDKQQESIIFRLDDLVIAPGTMSCSNAAPIKTGGSFLNAINKEFATTMANGPGATSQIDLAVVADFEFASDKGASAEADMVARINNVDGIFSEQLGVQLNVNRIDVFTDSNDPFTDEANASSLIDELSDFRNANASQFANGLTHLFTGRNLDGSTVGIAYTGALCSRRFGAGLTQGTHSLTVDSLIAAHEIGHNFGAPHDGTSGSACEAEAESFLMAPSVNGSDEFSACSISEMQQEVSQSSCVTALPSTDVAISVNAPSNVLLGDTFDVTYSVDSVGTDDAANASATLTIPNNVNLASVSTSIGSCSTGAGNATCSLGGIAAGASASITLSFEATGVGTTSFSATVDATADANSNNNQSSRNVDVDPAVDLQVSASSVQVALNESITVRPGVENRSVISANNVDVVVTPAAGVDITAASWSAGNCSITNGVATCQASSLAAGANMTLDITVTGTVEGAGAYTVSANATETERDASNNEATGQITVGPVVVVPAPPTNTSGDNGGGAFSYLALLALLLIALSSAGRRVSRDRNG